MIIEVGKKFKGVVNDCLIQITSIEKGYVNWLDLKTNKTGCTDLKTFNHMLLKEVDDKQEPGYCKCGFVILRFGCGNPECDNYWKKHIKDIVK